MSITEGPLEVVRGFFTELKDGPEWFVRSPGGVLLVACWSLRDARAITALPGLVEACTAMLKAAYTGENRGAAASAARTALVAAGRELPE